MHPFIDPSSFSEEDLNHKIIEVQNRLFYARNGKGNTQMIQQLSLLLETLQAERTERLAREKFEAMQKAAPEVIESDPEFKKDVGKEKERGDGGRTGRQGGKEVRKAGFPSIVKRYAPGAPSKPHTPDDSGS